MGFFAPELEIVILARTSVGTIPIKIKNFWLQGPSVVGVVYAPACGLALAVRSESSSPISLFQYYYPPPPMYTGKMRIEVDLVPRYPHMQTMAVTFLGTYVRSLLLGGKKGRKSRSVRFGSFAD